MSSPCPGKRQDFEPQSIWLSFQACASLQQTLLLTRTFSREHNIVANRHLVKDHKLKIQYKVAIIPEKRKPRILAPFGKIACLSEMDY